MHPNSAAAPARGTPDLALLPVLWLFLSTPQSKLQSQAVLSRVPRALRAFQIPGRALGPAGPAARQADQQAAWGPLQQGSGVGAVLWDWALGLWARTNPGGQCRARTELWGSRLV